VDYAAAEAAMLVKLAAINDHYVKQSLFYRVLAGGKPQWTLSDIKMKVKHELALLNQDTDTKKCFHIVKSALEEYDNDPCVRTDKKNLVEKAAVERCTEIKHQLFAMTEYALGAHKWTHFADLIVPYLAKQRQFYKKDLPSYDNAAGFVCNQLKTFSNSVELAKKKPDPVVKVAFDSCAGNVLTPVTKKSEVPECQFCREFLTEKGGGENKRRKTNHPPRTDWREFWVYERFMFVFEKLLHKQEKDQSKLIRKVDELWVAGAKNLAFVQNWISLLTTPLNEDVTYPEVLKKGDSLSDDTLDIKSFATAVQSKMAAAADLTARIPVYCGIIAPQCLNYDTLLP